MHSIKSNLSTAEVNKNTSVLAHVDGPQLKANDFVLVCTFLWSKNVPEVTPITENHSLPLCQFPVLRSASLYNLFSLYQPPLLSPSKFCKSLVCILEGGEFCDACLKINRF